MAGYVADISWKEWCCQTGLNCRPLHYQWSALPLSYGSMPGIEGNRPKWPPLGGRFLPQGPLWRKHAGRPERAQNRQKSALMRHREARSIGPTPGRSGSRSPPQVGGPNRDSRCLAAAFGSAASAGAECSMDDRNPPFFRRRRPLTSLRSGQFGGLTMKENQDRSAGKSDADVKDSRRDRLKLALRENLKRRKSQARGRSDVDAASSENADASLDDASGEKP